MPKKLSKSLIEKLERRLERTSSNSILVCDTSAIIELERNCSDKTPEFLKGLAGTHCLIFPESVKRELALHNEHYRIANRKEISDRTIGVISETTKDSRELLRDAYCLDNKHDVDLIRYHIYLAMHEVFKNDYKKSVKDPFSETDREVVESGFLIAANGMHTSEPSYIRVLSTDGHILETIRFLNKHDSSYPLINNVVVPYSQLNVHEVYGGKDDNN